MSFILPSFSLYSSPDPSCSFSTSCSFISQYKHGSLFPYTQSCLLIPFVCFLIGVIPVTISTPHFPLLSNTFNKQLTALVWSSSHLSLIPCNLAFGNLTETVHTFSKASNSSANTSTCLPFSCLPLTLVCSFSLDILFCLGIWVLSSLGSFILL